MYIITRLAEVRCVCTTVQVVAHLKTKTAVRNSFEEGEIRRGEKIKNTERSWEAEYERAR